jgi:hypothetical protein
LCGIRISLLILGSSRLVFESARADSVDCLWHCSSPIGPWRGQSSVRFPIAVSWSNRTELITKPAWRAQIGVSYDLDSLFAR